MNMGTAVKAETPQNEYDPEAEIIMEILRQINAELDEIAEKLGCPIYLYGGEYGHCVFDEAPDYKQRMYHFFKESHQ